MLKAKEIKKRLPLAAILMTTMPYFAAPAEAYLPGGECAKPLQEQYEHAEIAVLAELESIAEGDIGTLKVLKTYKGNVKVGERIRYKVLPKPNLVVGGEQTFVAQPYDDIGDIVQIFVKTTPDEKGVLQPSGCWRTYDMNICKRNMEKCISVNPFTSREK